MIIPDRFTGDPKTAVESASDQTDDLAFAQRLPCSTRGTV